MDAKGRVSIASKYREELLTRWQGKLTLTRHPRNFLLIYPREVWAEKCVQMDAFPPGARPLKRMLIGCAVDIDLDASARILIPPELRAAAQLDKEVEFRGMGDFIELWNAAALAQDEAANLSSGKLAELADELF